MPNPTGPVLVVDDDEAVRHSLKFALELEGLDVRLYENGAELLRDAALPRTGCLVVDYAMPEMDGFQLVGHLRDREVGLPSILITGRSSGELRHRAARAGFSRVVEKPFEDGSLLDGIHDALTAFTGDDAGRLRKTP
jgi:FixJ family two-component response regulator